MGLGGSSPAQKGEQGEFVHPAEQRSWGAPHSGTPWLVLQGEGAAPQAWFEPLK